MAKVDRENRRRKRPIWYSFSLLRAKGEELKGFMTKPKARDLQYHFAFGI